MAVGQVAAWLRRKLSDPAVQERARTSLERHPALQAQAEETMAELDELTLQALSRPDAAHLFLSAGEVAPWLPMLTERVRSLASRIEREGGPSPDDECPEELSGLCVEVANEMAPAVLTPERIGHFRDRLREYAGRLEAGGEGRAAEAMRGSEFVLQACEDDPTTSQLLLTLCATSLWLALQEQATGQAGGEGA